MTFNKEFSGYIRTIKALKKIEDEKKVNDGSYIAYSIEKLPESEWTKCGLCGGTGSYYESGDCHRSAGTIPCPWNCHNGIVKTKRVERRVWPKQPYYG